MYLPKGNLVFKYHDIDEIVAGKCPNARNLGQHDEWMQKGKLQGALIRLLLSDGMLQIIREGTSAFNMLNKIQ